jgi:2-polyprenyl-3-methyl-5-hydroxy-6-metoxy-1,4-benzoquinol methylase
MIKAQVDQAPPALALVCPAAGCGGPITRPEPHCPMLCGTCGRTYPITDGIPQLLGDDYDRDTGARYERDGAAIADTAAAVGYEYDRQHTIMRRAVADTLSDLPPGCRILDVGCGHGKFTRGMTRSHAVVGVDLALAMLSRARKEGLEVYQADATALPFADSQFDAIVCAEMVQHLSALDGLAIEFKRVLRPDGRIIVTTLNRASILRRVFRLVTAGKAHPLWRTSKELAAPFETAGFRVHRTIWTHFPLMRVRAAIGTSNHLAILASNIILDARLH